MSDKNLVPRICKGPLELKIHGSISTSSVTGKMDVKTTMPLHIQEDGYNLKNAGDIMINKIDVVPALIRVCIPMLR